MVHSSASRLDSRLLLWGARRTASISPSFRALLRQFVAGAGCLIEIRSATTYVTCARGANCGLPRAVLRATSPFDAGKAATGLKSGVGRCWNRLGDVLLAASTAGHLVPEADD